MAHLTRNLRSAGIGKAFGFVVLATGCSAGVGGDQGLAPEATGQASLELTAQIASDVAGTYRAGPIAIRFEAQKSDAGSHWVLYKSDGGEMFRVEQVADAVVTTILGSYRQRIDGSALAKVKAGQTEKAGLMAGVSTDGDPAMLRAMEALPEFAALPGLSQALGQRGIYGRDYPITLSLHLMAKRVTELGGKAPPGSSSSLPAASAASDLRTQGLSVPIPCYVSGTNTCCDLGSGYKCHPTPPPPPSYSCADLHPYPDLQCDPNHDDCFGMCGPDCTCWESVCGDCEYHATCAQHDYFCRQADNASAWDWLSDPVWYGFCASQCYAGDSVLVAAVGCGAGIAGGGI